MNISEAYCTCHEMMMLAPGYIARENAKHTYILLQLSDTSDSFYTSSFIIDPGVPESGNFNTFVDLQLQQQVALLTLPKVGAIAAGTHAGFEKVVHEKDAETLRNWILQQLKKADHG